MLESSRRRIVEMLDDEAPVLDVGGWAAPFGRADVVLDLMPYETRGLYGTAVDPERFDADSWVTRDMCDSEPWPFDDDEFDFAVCSHTLEDLRDPIRVCAELSRVARAGYIEVPAPVEELTVGVHGNWVGWAHHRWITEVVGDELVFTMKSHSLRGPGRHLRSDVLDVVDEVERVSVMWWTGTLKAREQVLIDAAEHDAWMAGVFAGLPLQARAFVDHQQPSPTVATIRRGVRKARRALGRGRTASR